MAFSIPLPNFQVLLTSIKLSGFKSFVDPATIRIRGRLIGVVGPNGCGKSNIIDAVRWVLGESRASELRGESMNDVIFNGTAGRKPAGRASVELTFDNSQGRLAGQWGKYSEITVRRVLTRDGSSVYSINNITVRRKDVQDMFLGTGLGPRAYAIIGQGMISRIIEARPEELRVFLEEAAGVSKYRERRKETENRLQAARDNLNRVNDILSELSGAIEKLRTQAAAAAEYMALDAERTLQQKLLWLTQKRQAEREAEAHRAAVESARTELERLNAELFSRDAELEKTLVQHEEAGRALSDAQGELYRTNSEIGGIEARIRYVAETRKNLNSQIAQLETQKARWEGQAASLEEELEEAEIKLEEAGELEISAQETADARAEELPDLEGKLDALRKESSGVLDRIRDIKGEINLAASRCRDLASAIENAETARQNLLRRRKETRAPDPAEISALENELEEKNTGLEEVRLEIEELLERLPEQDDTCRALSDARSAAEKNRVENEARLNALKQVQEKNRASGKRQEWLAENSLAELKPLWETIAVEPGWETALEAVLSERIRALGISSLNWTPAFAKGPLPGRVAFFETKASRPAPEEVESIPFRKLSDLVQSSRDDVKRALDAWLRNVYTAESLNDALAERDTLPEGAVFITPEGHTADSVSVRLFAPESDEEGMFSRQLEIERLEDARQGLQSASGAALSALRKAERERDEIRMMVSARQGSESEITGRIHEIDMALLKLREEMRLFEDRKARSDASVRELAETIAEKQAEREAEEEKLEKADRELGVWQEKEAELKEKTLDAEDELASFRGVLREAERSAQQASFEKESLKRRIEEVKSRISGAKEQLLSDTGMLEKRRAELKMLDDSAEQENLSTLVEKRLAQEKALAGLREAADSAAQRIRTLREEKMAAERDLGPQREKIVALQLKEQASRMTAAQFAGMLTEARADIDELDRAMPAHPRPAAFQAEIARLAEAIEKLGPVNLGAAAELAEGENRRKYLNGQHEDLTEAISTLEDAIRRIDRETRQLIKSTFDQVNRSLDELFPVLFGGGHAELLMTGEEILDAGVQIMAQPPGKKNATIYLLSGGEKALTAIALVFSLFQLNPAPFCLLDEVDAPLDDANTERFSNMVKRMSDRTQFLFISHNRLAMEMAGELVGVTMQEQGVSRIVAVDIQDAAEFSKEDPGS